MDTNAKVKSFLRLIDLTTEWFGKFAGWLVIILIGVVFWEVISRYLFNAPTIWAFEMSCFLYASSFLLGMGYTLQNKKHVSIETFSNYLSPRKQALLTCVCYMFFFFIIIPPLIVFGIKFAGKACLLNEHSYSPWAPPLCYIKSVLPLSFFILLVQGIADFIRRFFYAVKGVQF